jgi:hypothetical protein
VDVRAGFWQSESYLSSPTTYQIVIACPDDVYMGNLPIHAIQISFTDGRLLMLEAGDDSGDYIDIGLGENAAASLKWDQGRQLVISGQIVSEAEEEVQVGRSEISLILGVYSQGIIEGGELGHTARFPGSRPDRVVYVKRSHHSDPGHLSIHTVSTSSIELTQDSPANLMRSNST